MKPSVIRLGMFCLCFIFPFATTPLISIDNPASGKAEQADAKSRGSLKFEEEVIRRVSDGSQEKVEAIFRFVNEGQYPVTISDVVTSCGCTTANLEKLIYKPGETGDIKAIFKVGKFEGIKKNRITVETNDIKKRRYFLSFEIEIPKLLELSPRILYWRPEEAEVTKTIVVRTKSDVPISIRELKLRNKGFLVELVTLEAGSHYEIQVRPDPDKKHKRSGITIVTDYPPEHPKTYYAHLIQR